jgi:hypothetical protein
MGAAAGRALACACAQGAGYSLSRQQAAHGRKRKRKPAPEKKKSLGKKLEERNKMDLNKIWEIKRGDMRAAPTIAAGQAHAADHDKMVMRRDGGAGGKGRGTGGSMEKDDCAISGRRKIWGGLWELERWKRF